MSRGAPIITILVPQGRALPSFIPLIHRHFEKEMPEGKDFGVSVGFVAPVDLLSLSLPPELVSEVESVEVVYGKA